MNGVKVKTINYDALSIFFNTHISRETLVREIASIKFPAPFEAFLTNYQFIQTKKDLSEIIESGELEKLTLYISEPKNQIAVNYILKKTNTSSAAPMMELMYEIYSVLSIFVSYSRKTGLSIKDIQLVEESNYCDFISTVAVKNNEVSRSIAHLIDWDAYICKVSLKIRPVELNLRQTFFVSGSFRIHYPNPLTLNTDSIEIEKKAETEKNTISVNDFINSLESKNIGSGSVSKKTIKNPFGRHRKYITYETGLEKELHANQKYNNSVGSDQQTKKAIDEVGEKNNLFQLKLGEINELLPPKQAELKKADSKVEMQKLFNGLEKIKS